MEKSGKMRGPQDEFPLFNSYINEYNVLKDNLDTLNCQMNAIIDFCNENPTYKALAAKLEKCKTRTVKRLRK